MNVPNQITVMSSLLRSTKFVRYFTGAARTLILNSVKTAEASAFLNSKALSAANNVFVRDYATTKKTESLDPLLQKLDSEVRRYGRITKRDIDEVLDEIQSKNDITSSQSLLVIRCCGELVPEELPEQRTLLVQKIWSVLTERGIAMDISHYNALLRVYIENQHPFSPAQFLTELENKGLQPNRVTYQRLMWRYCQEGDVEGATKVLEKMRELSMPVSEPVLNALVMGHAFHGDTEGAKAVLETMAGAGLQPSNRTYTLLACGYAKQGDIEGVEGILQLANEKDAYITDKDILDIIEHLAIGGHEDKVENLFKHLQKSIGYNQDVCNLILRLLNKGLDETAKKIFATMPKSSHFEDNLFKGAFFVKHLLRLNRSPDSIIKTCKDLTHEGLVPNAIYIATEGALQSGNCELAQKLFKELVNEGKEVRQHYYWPLLVKKGKEKDEEGLLQILRDMSTNNIPASGETLRDYVIPYLTTNSNAQSVIVKLQIANVPVIHAARNVMIHLLELGRINEASEIALQYRPRGQYNLVGRPLVNALYKSKDINSFINILHVISSKPPLQSEQDSTTDEAQNDSKNEIRDIGRIIKSAVKSLPKNESEGILEAAYAKGLSIDIETAEGIQQYLGENMTTKVSQLLSELSSSQLEPVPIESPRRTEQANDRSALEIESIIARLKEKGTNVNRLQKQLLCAYINEKNIEKVKSYLSELRLSNFELNTAILAQLFEFLCENDEIELAKEIRTEIESKNEDFILSRLKLIQMAQALFRTNRYDEAIQFLIENKFSDAENVGFLVNSKCWQILNSLAEQKDCEKVKEVTKKLLENNYVQASNVLFGPTIKAYLLNNDVQGALVEFEKCCKQYRCTPWKGELMKALIMKEDANQLQWLADLSTQIHGEVNILHDLVLAFVECGRLRQARRILETPGLQARHRRLDDACQRYVEEGKSEYLEGLLEATKELSHIDRSNIFYHLLVTYCNADETDKALGLWTLLQEESEVPSNQFLVYLGNHLKSKNRDVPFIIPEKIEKVQSKKEDIIQKIVTPKVPPKPTKAEISTNIEALVKDGNLAQAMDVLLKSIEVGTMPKSNVVKYLLKNLAEEGNVEKIQQLGKNISENTKRKVTYDDKLTLAIFRRGAGGQHIDNLLESVEAANIREDLEIALRKFPRSSALANLVNDTELVQKCTKIAEIAASKGITTPVNLLWMELILAGKDEEARDLWNKWLITAPVIVFRRLLQESFVKNEPEIIMKLINALKTNKTLPTRSLGNAYSRLMNYYLLNNNIAAAEALLSDAIQQGVPKEHINKSSLLRLKSAIEATGKEFKQFEI